MACVVSTVLRQTPLQPPNSLGSYIFNVTKMHFQFAKITPKVLKAQCVTLKKVSVGMKRNKKAFADFSGTNATKY